MKLIPFGEYLKRYIYRKAGLTEPFCQRCRSGFISRSFWNPSGITIRLPAFEPTTAKLSALSRKLADSADSQAEGSVSSGFGLAMSVEDVNEFPPRRCGNRGLMRRIPSR